MFTCLYVVLRLLCCHWFKSYRNNKDPNTTATTTTATNDNDNNSNDTSDSPNTKLGGLV